MLPSPPKAPQRLLDDRPILMSAMGRMRTLATNATKRVLAGPTISLTAASRSSRSGDDAQLALAARSVADDPELLLETGEVALLGLLARVGVAFFALGLLGGLVAEVGDRQL